ncbi:isopenicillin N synthase family dioxygenase [Derxia lacustris]|uniref:isopenicillin N synthase family dioxygenase n=1 Tax=Derxia lacustris TaxID=764842 RepID=UPI000A1750F5|nr:2-oxoglutarate and iron-dependent oxygenase domain-containing protein [Derxia lacustris]
MVQYLPPQRALAPVLDIARWRDGSDKPGVAREFDRICREIGFFYLTGHGMAPARMRGVLAEAERFFALPDAAKRALTLGANRRGYEPMGLQSLDFDAPPDLKESLLIGQATPADHPYVLAGLPNYGPSRWPEPAALPGFRQFCESYFAEAAAICRTLMAIFAHAARLPEDHFEPMLQQPMATLRLIHYPPQPEAVIDNRIGCGAHTDWGAITLLMQDETGGLEVQAADGEWLYADPLPNAFVVNIGDMMPIWTDGAYHSNPHRVRNRSPHLHRYSAPFFMDLDYHARVECLPAFARNGAAPRFAPRSAGEHLDLMYRRSYGERAPAQE